MWGRPPDPSHHQPRAVGPLMRGNWHSTRFWYSPFVHLNQIPTTLEVPLLSILAFSHLAVVAFLTIPIRRPPGRRGTPPLCNCLPFHGCPSTGYIEIENDLEIISKTRFFLSPRTRVTATVTRNSSSERPENWGRSFVGIYLESTTYGESF